jgi:hypothetical protein
VAGSERRNSKTRTLLTVLVCFSLANLVFALLRLSLVRGIDRKLGRGGVSKVVLRQAWKGREGVQKGRRLKRRKTNDLNNKKTDTTECNK